MSGEFIVNPNDNFKKSIYHIKNILKEKQELIVKSGAHGSFTATIVCENLQRNKYVTITGVSTVTRVHDEKRKISLNITIKKTQDFDKLCAEAEEKTRKYREERENNKGN